MAKRAKGTHAPATPSARPTGSRDKAPRPRSNANVMNAATDLMGRTVSGVEDVGREIGATAVAAIRGSLHATERLGADLLSVARSTVEGTIDAAERIGSAATRAVKHIANVDKPSRKPSAVPAGRKRSTRRRKKSRPSAQAGSATP